MKCHTSLHLAEAAGQLCGPAIIDSGRETFSQNSRSRRVDAGTGMPITRPGIEQSFDVGVVIVFRDRGALENFEKTPRHLDAIREVMQPLAKRYVIYNFSND